MSRGRQEPQPAREKPERQREQYLVGFQQRRYQFVDFEIGDVLADAGAVTGAKL